MAHIAATQMRAFSSKQTQPQPAAAEDSAVGGAAPAPEMEVIARVAGAPEAFLPVLAELSSLANPMYAPVRARWGAVGVR